MLYATYLVHRAILIACIHDSCPWNVNRELIVAIMWSVLPSLKLSHLSWPHCPLIYHDTDTPTYHDHTATHTYHDHSHLPIWSQLYPPITTSHTHLYIMTTLLFMPTTATPTYHDHSHTHLPWPHHAHLMTSATPTYHDHITPTSRPQPHPPIMTTATPTILGSKNETTEKA